MAAIAAVVAVVLLVTSGDESDPTSGAAPEAVQPGAPGEPSRKVSDADVEIPKHTQADVDYMQGMIHHHRQALVMTGYVAERSVGKDIPLLSKRLEISQRNEIELIEAWLEARDIEPSHGHGDELMPGMLTDAQLAQLEAAKGRRFNRLFLRDMIRHHQGALTMTGQLYEANGGVEPEIDRFARHVEADQNIEIGRMRSLLAG